VNSLKNINNSLYLILLLFFVSSFKSYCQTGTVLDSLLKNNLQKFNHVLVNPEKYKLSIIYTRIDRDKNNKPDFTTHTFNVNGRQDYFYPASTVKLPVAMVAMAKLDELKDKGITRETTMYADSGFYCQKKILKDESAADAKPSIGNYIRKMFLVSDNIACARTYEFIGCDYLHRTLEKWNFPNIRLNNKLDGKCPGDTAKITPPIYFVNQKGDTLYKQPLTFSSYNKSHPIKSSKVGEGYVDGKGRKTGEVKDFGRHNYLSIQDLHYLMQRLLFSDYLPEQERLPLSGESRKFLIEYLGMYPRESEAPRYEPKTYYDSYKKYFLYGSSVATIKVDSVRIFNIVGRAFGFLIDCAYIVDFKNKTEFLLTAGIYVNERNTFGSGHYEYDKIGLPFLKELSKSIYTYERKRKKAVLPDLNEFNFFGYQ
jgi:hypothetical protein